MKNMFLCRLLWVNAPDGDDGLAVAFSVVIDEVAPIIMGNFHPRESARTQEFE